MENTTLDSIFSQEDKEEMEKIQSIRRNILKYIGITKFIDIVRDLIDKSKYFQFTSATKRKFINTHTPIFTIKYINPKFNEKMINSNNQKYIDKEINNTVVLINNDILKNVSISILEIINNDVNLSKIYESLDEDIRFFLWSTIFEFKVSLKDNIIYMRYCI